MTQAADRLESVDDRLHHMEQEIRAHTEVLSLVRSELDRQGRTLAALEPQMKSLEEAAARLAAATDRADALVREAESRSSRVVRVERVAIAAAVIALIAVAIVVFRGSAGAGPS